MKNEISTPQKSPIAIGSYQGSRSILLNSLSEIHQFATMVTKTDLVPKGYRGKPEDATVAIIYGMEIGLPPMSSLQNISVVNGTPAVWGDAQLSLVQSSGKYEYHKSSFEGDGENLKAVFEVKRAGSKEPVIKEFSVSDAKKAGLWGKSGTWTTHPKVMLSYKARAFALREAFADILKGMHSTEEMEGEIVDVTPKSKTAAAHGIPAAISKGFNVADLKTSQEEVVEANDSDSTSLNTQISDQMAEYAATIDEAFERVREGINTMTTERAVNAYFEKSAAEDLAFLRDNAPKMFGDLVELKAKRLEELK